MIEGKTVLIAGFARTGQAVAEFLRTRDCKVLVSEMKPAAETPDAASRYPGVAFEFGGHTTATFLKADVIILSPGIPDTIPPVAAAREKGIPVLSEIELAYHYLRGTIIGITGTNGKSTTTELTGAMLKSGHKQAFVCGNLGDPLIEFCNGSQPEHYYVVELSSFQLESISEFRPHISAIINLAEDHLDRYPSVEPYFKAKMRIFENQMANDFAVINYDDPYLRAHTEGLRANRFWFSRKEQPPSGLMAGADGIVRTVSGGSVVNYGLGALKGVHNLENTLCAASIAMLCGILPKAMQAAIESFRGLHHRMEFVREVRGVRYYDDSKATNVDAVVKSLESFPGGILLILGGKDKGCDYRVLRELVRDRVKHLFLIGEAAGRIAREIGDVREPESCESLEACVRRASAIGTPGDVVLLSPACSSFDMFRDYKHRGDVFVRAVQELEG